MLLLNMTKYCKTFHNLNNNIQYTFYLKWEFMENYVQFCWNSTGETFWHIGELKNGIDVY